MNVLQYVNNLSNGGIAQYQKLLVSNLADEKINFSIITRSSDGNISSFFSEAKIPVENIKIKGIKDYKSLKKLRNHILDNSADIIHTHSVQTMIYSILIKPFSKCPVIWSDLHSYSFRDFGEKMYLAARFCAKYCDQIIVGTEDRKKEIVRELKVKENKIKVINAGIDINKFNFEKVNGDYLVEKVPNLFGRKIITIIGRLSEEKGHKYLIEAAEILKDAGYRELTFLIVGEGPLKKDLQKLIDKKNLNDYFLFFGQSFEIPKILKGTDIAVLPALYDNMAYAILESLSMKVPVIASNVGGIPEVIKNLETGILIDPKDSLALARNIDYLLKNNEIALRIGSNGEELVRENFTLEKHANDIKNIYLKYV